MVRFFQVSSECSRKRAFSHGCSISPHNPPGSLHRSCTSATTLLSIPPTCLDVPFKPASPEASGCSSALATMIDIRNRQFPAISYTKFLAAHRARMLKRPVLNRLSCDLCIDSRFKASSPSTRSLRPSQTPSLPPSNPSHPGPEPPWPPSFRPSSSSLVVRPRARRTPPWPSFA